jgi:hypothetical protein
MQMQHGKLYMQINMSHRQEKLVDLEMVERAVNR